MTLKEGNLKTIGSCKSFLCNGTLDQGRI